MSAPLTIEYRENPELSARAVRPAVRYTAERDGRKFRSFWLAHEADTAGQRAAFLLNVRVAVQCGWSAERLGAFQMEEVRP